LAENGKFHLLCMYLFPSLGGDLIRISEKTSLHTLSRSVDCLTIHSVFSTEYKSLTYGQSDRNTIW